MAIEKKRFRFYWHLFWEFLKRHLAIILGLVVLIGAVVFLDLKFSLLQKKVFRIGLVGQYETQNLPQQITRLISQGLVTSNPDGSYGPAAAQGWQINNKGKEYVFQLQDNLSWDDGRSLAASDINYSYQDLSVTAQDKQTLIINLQESFSPLLTLLSQPIFKKNLIGLGEDYRVKKVIYQGNFINTLTLESKTDNLPWLKIRFYPDEKSLRSAFKLGEVDIIWGVADPGQLVLYPNIKIQTELTSQQYNAIFFNLDDDLLGFKPLRQALSYATPKPQGKSRAKGPISPDSWAYNDFVKTYDPDLSHARKLLEDNREELPEKIEITLATLPHLLETAEKTKKSWEQVGIKTNLQVVNFIPDNFQALLITQVIPQDPDQYWFWHSSQTKTNLTHLANLRIDQLLEEGRQVMNIKERREKYLDFQRFLLEESPAVFVSYPTYHYIYRQGFENAQVPLYNK
ncbi:MAG: ABC transporter substrate-binding protein [Candidatus Shapirobacteria bacterium]|nr:ABC transporter substrate-binding protein [Candidatus Shapirobacteria bacterium]MDD5073950.1 ABC transporter substrate-binding protein [Candidatus Shapirobacteria bacterium]MDD5481878.1 ABC transporter substrate-binding protein [Candidatus Shapirobacteria bacterium]